MSLEGMKNRLRYAGGAAQQNRMINDKLRSMLSATKYSYQAARFQIWSSIETAPFVGLFNPVTLNENFDTKMISTEFKNGIEPGTYFHWANTDTHWICFLQDKTELAYFRGECRECNFKVQWVDRDKRLLETLISVIGPSASQLRTSASMQAKTAQDFPTANLKMLVQNNPENRAFFHRYQVFLINQIAYMVEMVDELSMPGVLQLQANEYYSNLIEDDIKENIRNAWNIQPIIPQYPTDYAIQGPLTVKPQEDVVFETMMRGGEWIIIENVGLKMNDPRCPAKIIGSSKGPTVTIVWDTLKSGLYTVGYQMPNGGQLFQRAVYVESLF
jgi:hypothetical protein